MGRSPTKNLHLPPGMRKRTKPSGNTYYYMEAKKDDGTRTEIPLGKDYMAALAQYIGANPNEKPKLNPLFGDVITKYLAEEFPKLAKNTQRVQKSDIKHLQAFFQTAPLDQIEPSHIKEFLNRHADKPTTANRCKRIFSTMWNCARGWKGYTNLSNPVEGIRGHKLKPRTVYVTDQVYELIKASGSDVLRDAMDLAYLTGQRPADILKMSVRDIDAANGHLVIRQDKTTQPMRILIEGQLAELLERIQARKIKRSTIVGAILVNSQGKALTQAVLRNHFESARTAAALANPEMAEKIKEVWFYDLRAKAADDTADLLGEIAASNLLGHDSVKTTQKHYLRKGKIVKSGK